MTLRPVRPADRKRVVELTQDVWEGRDYLPQVFERWVSDAGSTFQSAEIDGVVVGVQRLRPYAPGLMWYEGLRVASTHRRRGIARAMLDSAIGEAREQGFTEMRLGTASPAAVSLFEQAGFKRLLAGLGMLRAAPGGRAIAGLRPAWSDNISVAFVAGKGAALRDLLFALRYEADADGLDHVTIALPRRHPAAVDMNACGYDLVNADDNAGVYGLKL